MKRKKTISVDKRKKPFSVPAIASDIPIKQTEVRAVVALLSGILTGWNESKIEQKLKIPPSGLFVKSTDRSTLYSVDSSFSIAHVVNSFSGSESPSTSFPSYGFAICDTANNSYFVFIDASRKITVRQRISVLQPTSKQVTWNDVVQTIEEAEQEARKTQKWAVFNKEDI